MFDLFIKTFKKVIYKPAVNPNKAENMLITANAFKKACEIFCFKFSHDKKTMPIVPMITNMAFACELYIKYLFDINRIPQPKGNDGHNFQKMIDNLPEPITKEIIVKINSSYKEINSENFKERIEPIKKCFSNWRYIHEANFEENMDLELLVNLMLVLQIICQNESEKRRPTTVST
jgi:hypothetical protein